MPRNVRNRCATSFLFFLWLIGLNGCHPLQVTGRVLGEAKVDADARVTADASVRGAVDVKLPTVTDPGPMVPIVVRAVASGSSSTRIGLIDVDGLLFNQNMTGLYSVGENPVASFREKLEAASSDGRVKAIVVRINSPGGGVTACDIMADELRRFREESGKPVVACLMDVATAGAYYLAVGADEVVALPTALTGSIGAIANHYNLQDAMAQLNLTSDPIKSGPLIDMGSVTAPLDDSTRKLLQELLTDFAIGFESESRPGGRA